MSFFAFNQLYGQWHFMWPPNSCPDTETPRTNTTNKDKVPPKVKIKDPCPTSLEGSPQVDVSPKSQVEPSDKGKVEDKENPKATEEQENRKSSQDKNNVGEKEEGISVKVQKQDPQPSKSLIEDGGKERSDYPTEQPTVEAEEDLRDIDYLYLPSLSMKELEERIKKSPTARRKFRLWKETMGMCVYCGRHINALDFVSGVDSDIEHIIPQAIGGPSSFDNLVCSCRKCNRSKGDRTAMDYVLTLDSKEQAEFLNLLRLLVSSGSMSEEKYYNLLRPVMLVNFGKKTNVK